MAINQRKQNSNALFESVYTVKLCDWCALTAVSCVTQLTDLTFVIT